MADITRIKKRLHDILLQREIQKVQKKREKTYPKQERYMKDRMSGMTYIAIAKKYGVSRQAVSKSCAKYRKRMGLEGRRCQMKS
jgi:transposase-like protein